METPTFPNPQQSNRETLICAWYLIWFSIGLPLSKTGLATVTHFCDLATLKLYFLKNILHLHDFKMQYNDLKRNCGVS